jgi:hypothetical protein
VCGEVCLREGRQINFFSRGEGALVFRGRGYLVINTVQGKVQIEGFQEVKELPRGVRIKPPLSERLKVLHGIGYRAHRGQVRFGARRAA